MSDSQRLRNKRSTTSNGTNERSENELATSSSSPTTFPLPLTSLVGRERDVTQLTDLLHSGQARLLTLTGPGGVGKTRLALQVAAGIRGSFSDGVYFISLAPISSPDLVLSTIAQTLGIPESPDQPLLNSLCAALCDKHILLILDNFEQVVSAGSGLLDLLLCAPRLQVLVTSRTHLHVYGEHEYPVLPLSLPDPNASRQPSTRQLAQYEAVRLFIERARAAKSEFTLSNDNASAVAEICHRLDGLPLAIELAAARIKLLSPQALLKRLTRTLTLLTRGATSLPYRHQTLRSAIAWSYDLLSDGEKALFRSLSVFVGGCTLEAAEAVASGVSTPLELTPDPWPLPPLLDRLAALVDKSLLKHEEQEDGEARFSMLETIREFALERLEEDERVIGSEANDIRRLHAEYYLALAEEAEPHLSAPEQLAWANRIETEHDNLRAALATTLQIAEIRMQNAELGGNESDIPHSALRTPQLAWVGLRLAGAIWQFWGMRGYLVEGRRWLQLALDAAETLNGVPGTKYEVPSTSEPQSTKYFVPGTPLARAQLKALNGIGVLARLAGDFPAARQALEGGLTIARELGDLQLVAVTLNNLGAMANLRGDYASARHSLQESLAIRRELGLELEVGHSLTHLGNVAMLEGDYPEARRLHEEGLAAKRRAGDKQGIGHSLHSLATIALRVGDYAEARRLDEETLTIARELGNKPGMAYSLRDLGKVAGQQGDYAEAYKYLVESLALFRELEDLLPIIDCLIAIGRMAANTGEPAPAAKLLGAAHALLETTEGQLDRPDRAAYERDQAALRARLGNEAFSAAWEEGKRLSLDQAHDLALGTFSSDAILTPATPAQARNVSRPVNKLTPREVEVLQLVAAGLTNPGIAAHLHLSMGTVQTHVTSIFSKLNVHTRSAAVRYAFEHSLI